MLSLTKEQSRGCDIWSAYLNEKQLFRDMNSLIKLRYLESMIGATRASTFLENFAFDNDFYDQHFAVQTKLCVENGVDYHDHHLLPSLAACERRLSRALLG